MTYEIIEIGHTKAIDDPDDFVAYDVAVDGVVQFTGSNDPATEFVDARIQPGDTVTYTYPKRQIVQTYDEFKAEMAEQAIFMKGA